MMAMLFAEEAHRGQSRKYNSEPYMVHPRRVAARAAYLGISESGVAAAFLHDVVEDCGVSLDTIKDRFGHLVYEYVDMLTDLQTPDDGNRAERKQKYLQRLKDYVAKNTFHPPSVEANARNVINLKAIDILDNARSIAGEDPKFWQSVKKEMQGFLAAFGTYMHVDLVKDFKRHLEA